MRMSNTEILRHFGAVGVGAVYYAGISVKTLRELDGEGTAITAKIIIPVTQFLVVSSMIIHGLSIPIYKVLNLPIPPLISRQFICACILTLLNTGGRQH